ncbi:MAG: hypothetical protein HYZ93_03290 [Candidatus Omnitrophica bacterium]|nr:hypothetical protein [Candidatus Omnitrophota bacterium]
MRAIRRYAISLLLLTASSSQLTAVFAEELSHEQALSLSRGDYLYRQRQFELALQEYGQLPKTLQKNQVFRERVEGGLEALYRSRKKPGRRAPAAGAAARAVTEQVRVVRRKEDSDRNSDQSFDGDGLQVNEHLTGRIPIRGELQGRFVMDLDGFKDGHNDLRYRTLLADLFEGPSHLGIGDSASFRSPYFLRGSRLRGMDLLLIGPVHEFQAVAGAYPFWLEERDEYIYPRTVWGLRDRWRLFDDRLRFGGNLIQTRDNEKVRTIDTANQPRDNVVVSLDQELKLIPEVWFLKAAESYSDTDDNLLSNRFGENTKLKDASFMVESLIIQPWVRSTSRFERTGPDFRLLEDIPSGGVTTSKGITADRQFVQETLDFSPWGPLDLDLEGSWMRNNLDDDDNIGEIRQSWATANLRFLTPFGWPRPGIRQTWTDTVTVPGSVTRPSQTRNLQTEFELSRRLLSVDWTGFADYEVEHPLKDRNSFDEEERWSLGTRLSRPLGERLLVNGRYQFQEFDELFDEVREDGIRHEASGGGSLRLWFNASLSAQYTFQHGKLIDPGGTRLVHAEEHAGTLGFSWPYSRVSRDRRRKLSFSPGVTAHFSDFSKGLSRRPLLAGRLGLQLEAMRDWKLELMGEFRYDKDSDRQAVRTEESRMWLLWTSHWK